MRASITSLCVSLLAACSDDVGLVDAPMIVDAPIPGTVVVSWTLGHDGTPVTCSQIAANSVTVEIVKVGDFSGVVDSFSCTSAMGTSRQLEPGLYDLKLSLTGSGGTLDGPISRAGVMVMPMISTTVEPVAFDVDPSGTLAFRITTGEASNCTTPGSGITDMRIVLRDAGGTCVPTTFQVTGGGTYDSDCVGNALAPCIEQGQDVTAMNVPSGQHSMVLSGFVGAQECWRRTSSFVVRAAGQTTMLNPQTLLRDTVACPPP